MKITSPRTSLRRLHKDESAPNTVEWVLLIIVAMIVLAGIYVFTKGTKDDLKTQTMKANQMEVDAIKDAPTVPGSGGCQ